MQDRLIAYGGVYTHMPISVHICKVVNMCLAKSVHIFLTSQACILSTPETGLHSPVSDA